MHKQRGVSLTGLMFWGVIIAVVAILGMKVIPSAIEYGKLQKDIRATVKQLGPEATVADAKKTFSKYADIDALDFNANDLEISKDSSGIVISFDYEKRIHLYGNVSLIIAYQGSTAGK